MKTPKKSLAALLAMTLTVGLTACSGETDSQSAQSASSQPAQSASSSHTQEESGFPFTLTTKDGAWEATFDTDYQIYKDLTLAVELGYIHLSLNDGVWGNVLDNTNRNAYKASVNMRYAF